MPLPSCRSITAHFFPLREYFPKSLGFWYAFEPLFLHQIRMVTDKTRDAIGVKKLRFLIRFHCVFVDKGQFFLEILGFLRDFNRFCSIFPRLFSSIFHSFPCFFQRFSGKGFQKGRLKAFFITGAPMIRERRLSRSTASIDLTFPLSAFSLP